MSRSYKKHSGYTDRNPFMKAYANRSFRRNTFEFPSGKAYRKFTSSWEICDYSTIYFSLQQVIAFEEYRKIQSTCTGLYRRLGPYKGDTVENGKKEYNKARRK